jgi:hypothetical protein
VFHKRRLDEMFEDVVKLVLSFGPMPREAEILYWISEAKTRPEIGANLGVNCPPRQRHLIPRQK